MSSENSGYEKSDAVVKHFLFPMIGSVSLLVAFAIGLDQYFIIAKEKVYFNQVLKPESPELKELRLKESETLSSYKVLDKNRGVYQIPIERAMELQVLDQSK